jgi:hypothetical protein
MLSLVRRNSDRSPRGSGSFLFAWSALASTVAVVGFVLAALAVPGPARGQENATDVDLYGGVLPELRNTVAQKAGALDAYRIEAAFDPDALEIAGRVEVTFVNRTGGALEDVFVRLYPNDPVYLDAGMSVKRVRIAGTKVEDPAALISADGTVLRLPLAEALAPGDSLDLRIDFETALMTGPFDLGSFLGQDAWAGTWLLSDWHPVVAPYLPESGWYLDPVTAEDGPAVLENALYDVTVTAPDKLVVVATGTEIDRQEHGREIERRWVTGPVRGFVIVADDDYSEFTEEVGGTLVSAYADWEDAAMVNYARQALRIAVDALTAYQERFGPYPYTEFDVIVMPYLGGSGFAVSGMVFVSVYWGEPTDPNSPLLYEPDELFFEHAVAHEVGHQWWGISVESDYRSHTFLAEGLTNYLAIEFRAWTDGDEAAAEVLDAVIVEPYLLTIEELGDQVADRTGLDDLGDAHIGIVYGKGALGFIAIHRAIGDDAFYAALRAYADDFAFAISEPDDLLAAFEAASGEELDALWREWFNEAETTPDDVRELVRAA